MRINIYAATNINVEIPPFGAQLTSGRKILKMARMSKRIQTNMLPENLGSHETAGGSTLGIKKMLCRLKNLTVNVQTNWLGGFLLFLVCPFTPLFYLWYIVLVHDSGVRLLKPWKFKRSFEVQYWKALDNHIQVSRGYKTDCYKAPQLFYLW